MKDSLKYLRLVIGILFLFNKVFSQEEDIGALNLQLKNAKHDTTAVKVMNWIAELLYSEYPDSAQVIWERGIKLAERHIASEEAEDRRLRPFYKKQLSIILNNVSYIYQQHGDLEITFNNLERGLKINEELGNKPGMITSYNAIGYMYDAVGDVSNAIDYFHKALKLSEEIGDKKGMGISLNNIGYMYDAQYEPQKALEYYLQDLKIREEIKDEEGIANSINNIGTMYEQKGDFKKALECYGRSLKISESNKDKYGIALALLNIGVIYEKQGKYKEALDCFQRALVLREELNDKEGITRADRSLANLFLRLGKLDKAEEHAMKALNLGKELGFPFNISTAAGLLRQVYTKQQKYKDAFEMYELEVSMRDSISNEKTKKAAIKKQFQFAYEKKAAQDSIRHGEEQKVKLAQLAAQEAQLRQEKTQRMVLYGGLILVIGFSGFIVNRFRLTQKQKAVIEDQKAKMDLAYLKLHEKNKEVMDSINYARRIQNSLLPSEKYISRVLEKRTKA